MKLKLLQLQVFLMISLLSYCQKITIRELKEQAIENFDKEDGKAEKISQEFLKENDLIIYVDKKLKATLQQKMVTGKFQDLPVDNNNQESAPLLDCCNKYVIPKDPNYDKENIGLQLVAGKKTVSVTIATPGTSSGMPEGAKEDPVVKCKLEKLSKIQFLFIAETLREKLADDCGKDACDKCPMSNTVLYDFATNSITYSNSYKFLMKHPDKLIVKVGDPLVFRIRHANPYLYNVTISDKLININQETNSLLDLLTAETALAKVSDKTSAHSAQQRCELTLIDSVSKAVIDLQNQLNDLNKSMAPYMDAYCLRSISKEIREAIDQRISYYFGSKGITNFSQLKGYLSNNVDNFPEKLLSGLNELYQKLTEANYGYAYKIPKVKDVDGIRFLFNILPKDGSLALPVVKEGDIAVYTRGGFKIDVSSGLYFAPSLRDEEYTLSADSVQINSTWIPQKRLVKENVGKGEFGFSSFLHFYPRTGYGFNIAGVVGAGLNLSEKPQPRYFGGASFLLGRENRIAVTGGIVFGNVRELSNRYIGDVVSGKTLLPQTETTVEYHKRFKSSAFFSLTYNLGFINKKQQEQKIEAPETPSDKEKDNK